ncbi:hypothetical protein AN958_03337 [Leucoagaricus sp. SymC.cos]|nr:hypothetical protein AN958_03337 [Leucoagaricus sp. SymC.cos]
MTEHFYLATPNPRICYAVTLVMIISSQLTLSCIEIILVIRVYLLYNRSRRIKYTLTAIYTLGLSFEVLGHAFVIAGLNKDERSCTFEKSSPISFIMFSAGVTIVQGTMITMTCLQSYKTRQWSWLRSPITDLMLRDAFTVFLFLILLLSSIITLEILEHLPIQIWNSAFSWYISILSIIVCALSEHWRELIPDCNQGCRLILGMQQLAVSSESPPGLEFTSMMPSTNLASEHPQNHDASMQ